MNMNTMLTGRRRRPRNKFVAGCLGTITVIALLASAAVWWFIGRPVNQAFQSFQELQQQPTMEAQLSNSSTYAAPADGALERSQVERFIGVQTSIRDNLEGGIGALSERYEELGEREFTLMDALQMGTAYRDYLQLLIDARGAQIAALNNQDFSAAEYRWVRTEVLRAAGLPGVTAEFDGLVGALAGQNTGSQQAQFDTNPAPAANVELIQDMQEQLQGVAGLAVLGF